LDEADELPTVERAGDGGALPGHGRDDGLHHRTETPAEGGRMHRIDIVRATGAHHELTADHDGVIVADVVTEWARRHGQPAHLQLTDPAGGEWTFGTAGPTLELDATDFCTTASGRGFCQRRTRHPGPVLTALKRRAGTPGRSRPTDGGPSRFASAAQ
jgi:hypothetical protein